MTYLVQRLQRKPTEGSVRNYRFGELFELDYMCSAEFEFGAFPKFLRRMHAATLESFTLTINGIKVFGVYDTANFANVGEVAEVLQSIADGKRRLKEYADFPTSKRRKTDAWAAIDSGIIWSTENISEAIKSVIANSFAYMESIK